MNCKSVLFLVLAFGMVSCQSDKNPVAAENFRIQEPTILLNKNKDLKTFNAFSRQVKPDLTLADEIQFQEAEGSFNILYNSHCRFEQKELVNTGFRSNPKTARFFSFLSPEQLRLIGESKEGALCSFDFIALNPNGSRHNFKLPLVQMMDDASVAELSIMHPKTTEPINELVFEQWPEYSLKLAKSGPSQIHFNCTSGSKIISINQPDRLNLSSAPLQEFNLNWNLGVQTCRISQVLDSVVVAISKNILLLSPALNTQFKGGIIHHPRQTNSPFNPHLVSAVYRLEIINPDSRPIRVKMPKQNLNFTGDDTSYQFGGFILVAAETGSKEWTPDQIITIEPKKTLLVFHYARIDKEHCKMMFHSHFHNRNNIQFQIIGEKLAKNNDFILKQYEIAPYSIPPAAGGEHAEVLSYCARL